MSDRSCAAKGGGSSAPYLTGSIGGGSGSARGSIGGMCGSAQDATRCREGRPAIPIATDCERVSAAARVIHSRLLTSIHVAALRLGHYSAASHLRSLSHVALEVTKLPSNLQRPIFSASCANRCIFYCCKSRGLSFVSVDGILSRSLPLI